MLSSGSIDNCVIRLASAVKIVELLYVSIGKWVWTGFDDSDWGIGQQWNSNRRDRSTNNMQTVTKTNVVCILTRPCRSQRRPLMRRATDSVCRLSLRKSDTFSHQFTSGVQLVAEPATGPQLSGNLAYWHTSSLDLRLDVQIVVKTVLRRLVCHGLKREDEATCCDRGWDDR